MKKHPLSNQQGQMTIFIALIFQVLFIFFAMIINVGLIVHDKINLQNSVDLAAYYGAQRQAEVLNAIAHQNYQIHQAYKLLAWRIRVLGDLGNKSNPMQKDGGMASDVDIFTTSGARIPSICVNHGFWGNRKQNVCGDAHINIPRIPEIKVIAPFLPWNQVVHDKSTDLRALADQDCKDTTPMNKQMAVKWVLAYRAQVARAKETIRTYATNLSGSQQDFLDIRGDQAAGGAFKTMVNNLTRENNAGMGQDGFKFYNSLGSGDYKKWLHEIPIYPAVFYTALTQSAGGCTGDILPIVGDPSDTSRETESAREPDSNDNLYHSIYGVEKNPWMLAYVGVYAESRPHKPYLPFGTEITLKARAYAKPFGGRIGPWYFSKWPSGSNKSVGDQGDRIDQLAPFALDSGDVSSMSPAQVEQSIPNYSRFPGDTLGLKSAAAISVFKEGLKRQAPLEPLAYSGAPTGDDGLANLAPDVQASSSSAAHQLILGYPGLWIRDFEAAAVSPDIFDITYYSVDLNSFQDYTKQGMGKIFGEQKVPYDIGSTANFPIGVEDQMRVANQLKNSSSSMNYYIVSKPEHLLTAWAPSGAYSYGFPTSSFGKCKEIISSGDAMAVPGRCPQGGRVGYSVKIISGDYLKSSDLALGGSGLKGSILNPPPF